MMRLFAETGSCQRCSKRTKLMSGETSEARAINSSAIEIEFTPMCALSSSSFYL